MGVVCLGVGFLTEDDYWGPFFWFNFGVGLVGASFITELIFLFLSHLCDMQKMQILSFKVKHNITTMSNDNPKTQEPIKTEAREGNYLCGIKLEDYEG